MATSTTQELSSREREAVELHDQGLSNSQIAERMGIASPSAAGSYKVNGLRKLGRDGEIQRGGGGGGGGSVKVPSANAVVEAGIRTLENRVNTARERADQLTEQVSGFDPKAWVKAERERMREEIARMEQAVKDTGALNEQAEAERTRLTEQAEQARTRVGEVESEVNEEISKLRALAEQLGS